MPLLHMTASFSVLFMMIKKGTIFVTKNARGQFNTEIALLKSNGS